MSQKPFDSSKPMVVSQPVSTGPTSDAGKAISSRNAMRHGCCATETLLLPTESASDLKALEAAWLKAYSPADEAERHLVAELVQNDWFLQRSTRAYASVEADLYAVAPNPTDWTEQQQRKLGRFLRYKTAHSNNVHKSRKAIEDYRKARLVQSAGQQKLAISQERLKTSQRKNKPEPSWKEHLENMRQQAVSLGYAPPDADPTKR